MHPTGHGGMFSRMKNSWFAAAAVFTWHTFCPLVSALAQDGASLEILAEAARANADVPGLALMVASDGKEPAIAVAGLRVAGTDAAVTVDDLWHLGSITKSMTATLVARLVERGTVTWDETVGDRLAEIAPEMLDAYHEVSFRHLLSHRSGLPANISMQRFAEFGQDPEDPIVDRERWVRIALAQSPVGPLEETYLYSNSGFIIAGAMLEEATGVSWEDLMRAEVFAPLGITSAGFGAPTGDGPNDQPRGHTMGAEGDAPVPPNADNPAALGPAGRVHMSMRDIARYLLAHAQSDSEFLSSESWETLHSTPFGGNYAMGWVVTDEHSRWHNGSNTMWYAEVAFNSLEGKVAAVVVNDGDLASVQPAVSELLGSLLRH